jgi:HK97 family phage major capsid protein
MPQRTSRVRDLFPVTTTTANLIDYFRVTGFTNNASPVPERASGAFGLKPQSTLTFAPAQAPVRTIAHWEAAHRNVLADEPQLQALINNELLYGLRLTEDDQILNGTGTSEDLLGILKTSGIQLYSQSSGPNSDNKADAIRRSATKIMLAYYEATGAVVHPYDWEDIELSKDSQNRYLFMMNVAVGMQQTLWRMNVVDTPAIAEGTALVGAFGLGAQLYDREQANIRVAEQHADFFVRNAIVVLAEQRLALAVKRPESFVKVTF